MPSWSEQDIRIDGTSIMSRKFWIADRSGLEATGGFRSSNFEVAHLQGTMWKAKQLAEAVRSMPMVIDSCDEDGIYASTRSGRLAQLNANREELFTLLASESRQVTVERDALMPGPVTETWVGYAQASTAIQPQRPDDSDEHMTCVVDLVFADPTWYGAEVTPSVSGTTVVTNDGIYDATNMVLNFSGGSNYRLTNTDGFTDDIWVQIDAAGAIEVDVRAGTAYQGSTNVIGLLSKYGSPSFMRLAPGANTMTLTGGGSVTITYRPPRA